MERMRRKVTKFLFLLPIVQIYRNQERIQIVNK
jgi:hypothetical protein